VERPRISLLIGLAGVVLMSQAPAGRMAGAERRELVTVRRTTLSVHAQADRMSAVLATLMRGDLVEIDSVVTRAGGQWCHVTEIVGSKRSGYVDCEGLEREPTRPSETLRALTEKPVPKAPIEVRAKKEGDYTIQVASLVVEGNALSLKQRLEKLGYTPVIRKVTAPITRHRVYGGEFSSRAAAEQAARHLQADGFPSTLIEEGGKFRLEVGSSFSLNEAIDLAHRLQKKNHPPKIVSEVSATPIHQVLVEGYRSEAEALKALESLRGQGFAPIMVRE
jgi:cell division protein FtsN